MNNAEQRRDFRITSMLDLELLDFLCRDGEVEMPERSAFRDMRSALRSGEQEHLSLRQRAWAENVARRITPISAKDVPVGAEVETPEVLKHLPKKPPRRVADV